MATMSDVARRAGVSVSTVSHVVNSTRLVANPKRKLVLDAIDELGYVHNAAARALRTSRSESVGVVVSDASEPAFAAMVRGIEQEARMAGFTLLLTNSAEDVGREADSIAALVGRRVDGLIVARAAGSALAPLETIRARGMPIVLLDRFADASWDQVGVDNVTPSRAVVAHMASNGHERIALIAGDTRASTLLERRQGFIEALQAAGVEPDAKLIVEGPGHAEDAGAAVARLLRRRNGRPTALFAASSPIAVGALRAMGELGIRTPDDLAFAHFDGLPYADLFRPGLTCIEQPAFEIGAAAMRLLLRRIAEVDSEPETIRLEPTIAHRESCGCPPGAPPILRASRPPRRRRTAAQSSNP